MQQWREEARGKGLTILILILSNGTVAIVKGCNGPPLGPWVELFSIQDMRHSSAASKLIILANKTLYYTDIRSIHSLMTL